VDSTNLTFAAGHNYRFIPQFRALYDAVVAGQIGRPFLVDTAYIQDLWGMKSLGPDYWRFKDPQDLFVGGAVHNVDLLQWLAGEISEVHSYANSVLDFWPVENNYTTNLKFKSGCIGHVLLELGAKRKTKFDVQLRAFGMEGSLEANNRQAQVVREIGEAPGDQADLVPVQEGNSHELELRHFVHCARSGERPLVDVHEAARVMSVCFAAVKSARQGGVVAVERIC
jgi:predicted dehydrogenase